MLSTTCAVKYSDSNSPELRLTIVDIPVPVDSMLIEPVKSINPIDVVPTPAIVPLKVCLMSLML